MFCENCGADLREGASFCPQCGLAAGSADLAPSPAQYSYETHDKLFPLSSWIFFIVLFAVFASIGSLVAVTEGFWFVPIILGAIVVLGIFIVAWGYKGKIKKWGVWRTVYILTPEGVASGMPADAAKRVAVIGAASAVGNLTRSWPQNWSAVSHGLNELGNIRTVIHGLPVWPWETFTKAEYRPGERKILLHLPTGECYLVEANPDNYETVEQLVRRYMAVR